MLSYANYVLGKQLSVLWSQCPAGKGLGTCNTWTCTGASVLYGASYQIADLKHCITFVCIFVFGMSLHWQSLNRCLSWTVKRKSHKQGSILLSLLQDTVQLQLMCMRNILKNNNMLTNYCKRVPLWHFQKNKSMNCKFPDPLPQV